ncbi:MAG: PhoPQ-activated protein PqaA family protein [Thermoguttaceae bacterium]
MRIRTTLVLSLSCLSILVFGDRRSPAGPLKDYVEKADDSYQWKQRRTGRLDATEYVELTLTSQTWRGIVWRHQLFILKPSTLRTDLKHSLLYIGGGNWRDELADPATGGQVPGMARSLAALAESAQTTVAVLLHVPQQPIFGGLVEDQIISRTFGEYLEEGNPEDLLLLPMVKSVVRAMDAVEQFAADRWSVDVETFTLTGASKRGWTTWLTGAVDRRATALAPMVIDVLNMQAHMKHQIAAWGEYSHQIHDYTDRDLPKYLDTPAGKTLRDIVDPYSYRSRLTQPKLILIGTNDPYWPLDSLNLYWKDLVGQNYILYVPNSGHGLSDNGRVLGGIHALHQHAATGKPLPKLSWAFSVVENRATLTVRSTPRPDRVRLWTATSATRDFRQSKWRATDIRPTAAGHVGTSDLPEKGFKAMFGEAAYETDQFPYYFSTNVEIVR